MPKSFGFWQKKRYKKPRGRYARNVADEMIRVERPEFREIIPIIDECKQSQAVAMLSNTEAPSVSLSLSLPMVTTQDSDGEERDTPPMAGHVSALRNHWEMEASRNSVSVATEEKRRYPYPQLDKNGYVSDPLSTLRLSLPLPMPPSPDPSPSPPPQPFEPDS